MQYYCNNLAPLSSYSSICVHKLLYINCLCFYRRINPTDQAEMPCILLNPACGKARAAPRAALVIPSGHLPILVRLCAAQPAREWMRMPELYTRKANYARLTCISSLTLCMLSVHHLSVR